MHLRSDAGLMEVAHELGASGGEGVEIDVDDVPWKDKLVTNIPKIVDGMMMTPAEIGWGTELNWEEALRHPWTEKSFW